MWSDKTAAAELTAVYDSFGHNFECQDDGAVRVSDSATYKRL